MIGWSLALIGLILALFAAITYLKRRWTVPEEPTGSGFTLADLRQLRREGKMTDEEFERAKALILATYKRAQARDAGAPAGKPGLPPDRLPEPPAEPEPDEPHAPQ
jgi:hypothetical protein